MKTAARFRGIRTELVLGLVVLVLASSAITWVGSALSTRRAFDHLVEGNDLETAATLAEALGTYWSGTGSWQGVEEEIRRLKRSGIIKVQGFEARRHNRAAEKSGQPSRGEPLTDDLPMILLDSSSFVMYNGFLPSGEGKDEDGKDSREPAGGSQDKAGQLASRCQPDQGIKVMAGGAVRGYVFFRSMVLEAYNPRETAFIGSLNLSIAVSVLVGVIFSFLVGIFLSGRFVRPLVRLESAVKAITAGDLESRVPVRGSSEVVSLASNFNAMADRLHATEIARQNLLADVAHELRTPVSILQANLEMMIEGVYQPDQARLASLYEETRLLSRLIGDLRTLSDLELNLASVPTEVVSLDRILEESVDTCKSLFGEQDMTLDLQLHARNLQVMGDSYRLMQVIRNLLDNALKYAGAGTSVRVATSEVLQEEPGKAAVSMIRVRVKDQGPGVPEADLERIFERFYRVDRSRNRETGGRGLGLALCKQFIQASGGRMGAVTGEGLEIWFQLPRAPGHP